MAEVLRLCHERRLTRLPVWREEAARYFPGLKLDVLKAGHDFVTNPEPVIWLASYTQLRKHRALP